MWPPRVNSREDYNKETDGRPCYPWNWGKDCGFPGSHGTLPDMFLHICAWCAYKCKRHLLHKEQDCLKKCRFLDKKALGDSASPAQPVSCMTNFVFTLPLSNADLSDASPHSPPDSSPGLIPLIKSPPER